MGTDGFAHRDVGVLAFDGALGFSDDGRVGVMRRHLRAGRFRGEGDAEGFAAEAPLYVSGVPVAVVQAASPTIDTLSSSLVAQVNGVVEVMLSLPLVPVILMTTTVVLFNRANAL